MLRPEVYKRAALEAEFHVQVEIDRVEPPTRSPGKAVVEGRVARIFRGDPALLAQRVSLTVPCRRGDEEIPDGGTMWTDAEELERAGALEAYLNRDGYGGYEIARYQSFPLDAVTDTPRHPVTERDVRGW